MSIPLEKHLADYLLSLQRGSWTQRYNRECLEMWREKYGDLVAEKAEKLVKQGWKK